MWQTTAQLGALHAVVTPTNTQEGHIIFPPECARAVTELGDSFNIFSKVAQHWMRHIMH